MIPHIYICVEDKWGGVSDYMVSKRLNIYTIGWRDGKDAIMFL